jgi:TRAP-type C4-dicarboxylate transport system permease small subunit
MLRRGLALLDRASAVLACVVLVALLVCVALGIVTRAADDPLIWTDELARFLMVWLAALGWIVSTRKRGHVRIRFFQNLLPDMARRGAEAAIQVCMAVLGGLVFWYGFGLVAKNLDLDALTLPVSMAWLYAPLIPAGLVTAAQSLAELYAALMRPHAVPP